jgi:hypothetical protein
VACRVIINVYFRADFKVSLAVHVAYANNLILRGLSAAADGVEATSSPVGMMPSHATAFFTRVMGHELRVFSRSA